MCLPSSSTPAFNHFWMSLGFTLDQVVLLLEREQHYPEDHGYLATFAYYKPDGPPFTGKIFPDGYDDSPLTGFVWSSLRVYK